MDGEAGMNPLEYDRVAVLEYIKQSVERLRDLAKANTDKLSADMLAIADKIAGDAAKLEAELVAAGYLPKAANED